MRARGHLLRRLACFGAAASLVLLAGCKAPPDTSEEDRRRDEFARTVALDAGARGLWLTHSNDIHFEWGFSDVRYDPQFDFHNKPFRWMGNRAFIRLRGHGKKPMHFRIQGWADQKALYSKPTISVYVNGHLFAANPIDPANGGWGIEGVVSEKALEDHEWVGLTLEISTVAWHWLDVPDLMVALVTLVEWNEETTPR